MNLLKELTQICAPSGNEEKIRNFIIRSVEGYVDELNIDNLGNLIAVKKSTRIGAKKVMLAAHMDEVGLIVTYIDDNGFARFGEIGRINPNSLANSTVIFTNGAAGIVRFEGTSKDKLEYKKMFIDASGVNIGDTASFARNFSETEEHIFSNALDDRVGCYILIELIRQITNPSDDIYFVFTAQEELGLRGATVSAFGIESDIAFAIDVTPAYDFPGADKGAVKLGEGIAVKIKDNSIICHSKVKTMLIDTAIKLNLKYQLEVLTTGGTDAGAIHLTKNGIPSGVLSIPTRYIHSGCEVVCKRDIYDAIAIFKEILK